MHGTERSITHRVEWTENELTFTPLMRVYWEKHQGSKGGYEGSKEEPRRITGNRKDQRERSNQAAQIGHVAHAKISIQKTNRWRDLMP